MARRRHDKEEEDTTSEVFTPPEFDKKEYIDNEINRAKAAIVPVLVAAVMGIVSAYIFLHLDRAYAWPVSAAIGLSGFILVKFGYPLAGIDVGKLKNKDYVGHAFMYFFAWLAIFIIFLNPPFADYSAPAIEGVHLEGLDTDTGNWTTYEAGGNYSEYRIVAFVSDNTVVSSVEISINGGDWQQMGKTSDGLAYAASVEYTGHGSITYQIKATDLYGHENIAGGTLP